MVVAARSAGQVEEVAESCRRRGGPALAVPVDVADEQAVAGLARAAVERFGRIDAWVNAAGVGILGRFDQVPVAEVRRLLDVNAVGALNGARAAVPVMRPQGGGVLADVASLLGTAVAAPYMGAYAMSKAALAAFDDVLRREPALQGESRIAVCTVLPTGVDTPFFRNAANHSRVPVGPYARSMAAAHALAPGLLRRGIARRTDRAYLDRGRPRLPQAGNLHTPTGARAALHGGRHGGARTAARRAAAAAAAVLAVRAALRGRPAPR